LNYAKKYYDSKPPSGKTLHLDIIHEFYTASTKWLESLLNFPCVYNQIQQPLREFLEYQPTHQPEVQQTVEASLQEKRLLEDLEDHKLEDLEVFSA